MKRATGNKSALFALLILLQSLIYGIGNPLTKVAYESMTPHWLLAARFTLAFVVLLLLFGKRVLRDVRQVRWSVWLPSALCCAAAHFAFNQALSLTSATNVGFLISLPVVFAPVLAALFLKRRYAVKKIPLQLLALVGVFLLCCNGGGFSFGMGEVWALVDAACMAGLLVFGERALQEMEVISVTALQAGMTAVVGIAAALLLDDPAALTAAQAPAWGVVAYQALGSTILAFFLQNIAVARLSASTVAMLQCSQPIMTAIVSFVLLHETLGPVGLLGAAVILIALLLESRKQ